MAGRSMKSLVGRRRRVEDEGEEDDGPEYVDDSASEASVQTEVAEGNVAAGGDGGGEKRVGGTVEEPTAKSSPGTAPASKPQKARKSGVKPGKEEDVPVEEPQAVAQPIFKAMADTEAMMNGLRITDGGADEAVDFSKSGGDGHTQTAAIRANGTVPSILDRQRREHEEYKKKRDSDPAFIPNRGNFFMHDTRAQPNGPLPPRGSWAARGRGRGVPGAGALLPPTHQAGPVERPAEQQWKHDLHSSVNEDPRPRPGLPARPSDLSQDQIDSARLFPRAAPQIQAPHQTISFSSTKLVGNVQIRVALPGMSKPVVFSAVPWKQYIRLPDHRPPLRRDKPVRVSIPEHTQRYIFPSTERSFIFIPRQMRPNQQRFGHSSSQRSVGGYGYSSRRTSMYGGSMYSASVAASRRSSLAGANRERGFSPAGSFVGMPHNRPVVRLPHGGRSSFSTPAGPLSGVHTPTGVMPQMYNVPPPQAPVYQGTPTTTVHQPRPQKTISVTGIESPAALEQAANNSQPFQNQLPAHMHEPPPPPPPPYFSPRQQYAYMQPPPGQNGTPLSGIPEQAIHAPAFQPPMYPQHQQQQQQPYYPPYAPQPPGYYYSPPDPNGYPPMPMYPLPPQSYMPGPPPPHMAPAPPPPPPYQHVPPPPPSQPTDDSQQQRQHHQPHSGILARESNGMVFYTSAAEAPQGGQGSGEYQPAESFVPSYAMPGLPPPTPAPDGSMGGYYYPPPQPPTMGMQEGMQEVGTGVYYPAGQGQGQGQQ